MENNKEYNNKDIVRHWTLYFMRPIFFPWEYFPDARLSLKQRMSMGQLNKAYDAFEEGMVGMLGEDPEFNAKIQHFVEMPSELGAREVWVCYWGYVAGAVHRLPEAIEKYEKVVERTQNPMVKGAVTLMKSKMVVANMDKIENLRDALQGLWLKNYGVWLADLRKEGIVW